MDWSLPNRCIQKNLLTRYDHWPAVTPEKLPKVFGVFFLGFFPPLTPKLGPVFVNGSQGRDLKAP